MAPERLCELTGADENNVGGGNGFFSFCNVMYALVLWAKLDYDTLVLCLDKK